MSWLRSPELQQQIVMPDIAPARSADAPPDASPPNIFETGSFSGYHTLGRLGSGYLTSSDKFKQPLCGNEEGWGPLSPYRWDFTPCFIDVWIMVVAVFGLVMGLAAAVWLLRSRTPAGFKKNGHFWLKQVRCAVGVQDLLADRVCHSPSPPS